MDYTNHNTSLRTNKHLSYEERFYIEKQLQANVSKSAIAKALGRSRTTIHTEIKRGTVVQIKQGTSVLTCTWPIVVRAVTKHLEKVLSIP